MDTLHIRLGGRLWFVSDDLGQVGGTFTSRASALFFVKMEARNRHEARVVIDLPDGTHEFVALAHSAAA